MKIVAVTDELREARLQWEIEALKESSYRCL